MTTATAMRLPHLVALHHLATIEIDSAIGHPDAITTATAIAPDHRDGMTAIATEMEEIEDDHPDAMTEAEMTEKTRERKISPKRRRRTRRRNRKLLLRLAVRNR